MTPVTLVEPKAVQEGHFEQQAASVLLQFRAALSALISSIPGKQVNKAIELQRALGIPNTLAWQVFRLAQSSDPLSDGTSVPGVAAMSRFFDAASARGVRKEIIEAGRAAALEFQSLVKSHAGGSRSAFDSMITSLNGNGDSIVDLQHRRLAFKANSHIWGVQAHTQLSCFAFRPVLDDGSQLDFVAVRGLLGLRRLRRDASWVVSHVRMSDDDGQVRRTINRTPIDPVEGSPGVSLLRGFCSKPVPKFRSVVLDSGFMNIELEPTEVGSKSAITCLIGDVYKKAFARFRDEHNQTHDTQTMVRTPCERLIHDVLVPKGVLGPGMPKVSVYGDHRNIDPALTGRECDLLAMTASAAYLGSGLSVLHSSAVPRYSEMVQYAMDRAGWDAANLDVYRCEVEYPVMPSSVVVKFDLLDR